MRGRLKHFDGDVFYPTSFYPLEHAAWHAMFRRCYNPRYTGYQHYGGRGIQVSSAWRDFYCFVRDVGRKPSREYSLDRIDPDGHYERGNTRWASPKEQARNRRDNRKLTIFGQTRLLVEWAEITGLRPNTIADRVAANWHMADWLRPLVRRGA